jgi:hypothetical protein
MSKPTVNILFNISSNDVACTNPAGDSNFLLMGAGDIIVWRDSQQMGGDLISGASYPAIIPQSGSSEVPKLFLMDNSEGDYQQVVLAGTTAGGGSGGNTRYVCCAWFSGATVTAPTLEAYDDNTHATWASKPLGDGTPANSVFKAIGTTDGVPGAATWTGTPLAGTDSYVTLDDNPLAGAGYVYWNMKQILLDSMGSWDAADWYNNDLVLAIHYTYS